MKHENDVSNIVGCLSKLRIYNFMNEIKSYILFLFVKRQKIIIL